MRLHPTETVGGPRISWAQWALPLHPPSYFQTNQSRQERINSVCRAGPQQRLLEWNFPSSDRDHSELLLQYHH